MRRLSRSALWLIVTLSLLVIFVFVLLQRENGSESNRITCSFNLKQIGEAISLYAQDHNGEYPHTFTTLLANEAIEPYAFVCPESDDSPASGPTTQATLDDLTSGGHLSYIYLGCGLNVKTAPADAIVAFEPLTNHKTGMNVLFADGHVDFVDFQDGQKIASQAAAGVRPVMAPSH